jgi:hypothetical protein
MPRFSVKIAGSESSSRHGAVGFPASNLVLGANEILCRPNGSSSLVGRTIAQIAAETNGISYFRTISDGTTNTVITGNGPHILALVPGPRISITPTYNGGTGTAQFTITSQTVLSSDAAPTLGANLNVSTFNITRSNANVLGFGATLGDVRYITVSSGASATGIPSLSATSSEASVNVDFQISPLRGGSLLVGGTSPTIKSAVANTAFTVNATSTSTTAKHINLESGVAGVVTIGALATNKHLALQVAANTFDVRITGPSNTNYCAFRLDSGGNTGIITNNTTGNLILVSGSATTGVIPTAGSTSVQFNSDILLSAKSIKAVDNNITVDTVTNDFTGSLKLKATSKSGFHRVKSGTITIPVGGTSGTITGTGGMSSGYLDVINYNTSTEKAVKYFMYIQNSLIPSESAVVEFNTIINGNNFRSLEIINTMVQSDGSELYVNSEEGGGSGIVLMNDVVGIDANGGMALLPFTPDCQVALPSLNVNEVGITLNKCMQGTYIITLYKMSIEA